MQEWNVENTQELIKKSCRNVFRNHAGMNLENMQEWNVEIMQERI